MHASLSASPQHSLLFACMHGLLCILAFTQLRKLLVLKLLFSRTLKILTLAMHMQSGSCLLRQAE